MRWWVWVLIIIGIFLLALLLWWLLIRGRRQRVERPMAVPMAEAPVARPIQAAPVVSEPATPDDLTVIEGIGPRISGLLQAAGIATFSQLAATDVSRLEQIVREAGLRVAYPGTWPEQATLAAAGKWQELERLQGQLKGGRRV